MTEIGLGEAGGRRPHTQPAGTKGKNAQGGRATPRRAAASRLRGAYYGPTRENLALDRNYVELHCSNCSDSIRQTFSPLID